MDLGRGLACKGVCEDDVAKVSGLIQRNIERAPINEETVSFARSNRYLGVAFYLVFGLLFLGFTAYQYFTMGHAVPPDLLLLLMGLFFIAFGLILLQRIRRSAKKRK